MEISSAENANGTEERNITDPDHSPNMHLIFLQTSGFRLVLDIVLQSSCYPIVIRDLMLSQTIIFSQKWYEDPLIDKWAKSDKRHKISIMVMQFNFNYQS